MRTHFTIQDMKIVRTATKLMKKILDNNYKKANSKKIANNLKYISKKELHFIHEEIFDGTLDNYLGSEYKIELLGF